ncbi:DNA/RNA non-specific endonuclease [Streptomyces goshikiensis]|uniref:DNA/RNA non-specific endonuclease n=1 Tax=Streptomyces goshikiensis TaxID=1942 RepID=UPI00365635F5
MAEVRTARREQRKPCHWSRSRPCSHFIDKANNPGSKPKTGTEEDPLYRPPGYDWAKRYAGHLGAPDPQNWRNACHLLAKQLSGSGERLDNLSTCSRAANANPYSHVQPGFEPNMYTYETKVKEAIDAGHVVHYQVTPKYDGARTVPTGYEMKATVYWKSGGSGQLFHDTVENKIYSLKFGEWYNM